VEVAGVDDVALAGAPALAAVRPAADQPGVARTSSIAPRLCTSNTRCVGCSSSTVMRSFLSSPASTTLIRSQLCACTSDVVELARASSPLHMWTQMPQVSWRSIGRQRKPSGWRTALMTPPPSAMARRTRSACWMTGGETTRSAKIAE